MAVLTLPSFPGPSQEDWSIENDDRSGGTSIVGTEQIVSSGSGRWAAKLTFAVYGPEILGFRAALLGLRGRFNTLLIGPRDVVGAPWGGTDDAWALDLGISDPTAAAGAPYPAGVPVAATLAAGAALGATAVSIAMQAGRRPAVGNYAGLRNAGLHVITAVTGAGPFTCAIEPSLRFDCAAGDAVEFQRPVCAMRLRGKLGGLPRQARGATTISLDLVEAL